MNRGSSRSRQVEQALNSLPETFRHVVMLVDVGELSYEEAAAAIGCAVGTVRSRLFRARKYLFAALLTYAREEGYATTLKERPCTALGATSVRGCRTSPTIA